MPTSARQDPIPHLNVKGFDEKNRATLLPKAHSLSGLDWVEFWVLPKDATDHLRENLELPAGFQKPNGDATEPEVQADHLFVVWARSEAEQ